MYGQLPKNAYYFVASALSFFAAYNSLFCESPLLTDSPSIEELGELRKEVTRLISQTNLPRYRIQRDERFLHRNLLLRYHAKHSYGKRLP
jgi:hypothetical protein